MDQFGELAPMVQILEAPVQQLVDKLEDVLKIVDLYVPVQEIEVPKISSISCPPPRRVLPVPQSAEQLVGVPTVLSPLRIAEQIVGIPVPQGRGKVQGSLPRQSSTATSSSLERISERTVEQSVDFPGGGLQDFRPGHGSTAAPSVERISERIVEQIVDTSPGGGLGQGSASSAGAADEDFTGVFRTFPHGKKSAQYRTGGECAAGWARQLIHAERSSNASCRRRFALGLSGVGAVLRHGWPLLLEETHV